MKTSLYIHIPFCRSKCTYCDFFSISADGDVPDSYIDALCAEISWRMAEFGADGWLTVYVGGGTPSLLSEKQLRRLFNFIRSLGGTAAECTVELNPDDVTPSLLECLSECGVNRISVGIQAMEQSVLSAVKRRSSLQSVYAALECIRRVWKGVFSADIICALPGQSESGFLNGLEKLLSYEPAHISMYSLTIEDGTPLGNAVREGAVCYDFDAADAMWISGRDFLESRGYRQYEVSNFYSIKNGSPCAHNLAYWKLQNYIGIGSGAAGSLYGRKSFRYTNTHDIAEYIRFWNSFDCKKSAGQAVVPQSVECIEKNTEQFEFFMMGFRTADGICAEEYSGRFGDEIPERILRVFDRWQKKNLLRKYQKDGQNWYALTGNGLLFLNPFLEEIM